MKKKILILGAHGMLGWKISEKFIKSNYKIILQVRGRDKENELLKKLNIRKKIKVIYYDLEIDKIEYLFRNLSKDDIIINCIGKIKPFINEKNNKEIYSAIKTNSIFPYNLSKLAEKKNINIYQIATDCVYSGKKGKYLENSNHDATDVYGKTKSLGEIKSKNFFNIRVSIIGHEINSANSLVEWFKLNKNNKSIYGFIDHIWNGVTTEVFSELLFTIIDKKIIIPNNINLVPKNVVNKFILMKYLKAHFKYKNIKIIKKNSNSNINRTLNTLYKSLNDKIWKMSKFKKKLTIQEMISSL